LGSLQDTFGFGSARPFDKIRYGEHTDFDERIDNDFGPFEVLGVPLIASAALYHTDFSAYRAALVQFRQEQEENPNEAKTGRACGMNESIVEKAALAWFEVLGYRTATGADISPGSETPLRDSHEDVVLLSRLRSALRKINDHLPEDAIEQAMRFVSRPPEPTLAQNNRWFHRLLTDGIDVEYRTSDGNSRGGQGLAGGLLPPRAE
jgi:hypothetical protein